MSLVVCLGIICSYAQDAPPQNAAAAAMPEIMSFAMTGELPGCKTYEYPAQKLSCGGHDFEAKAVAVYTYYPEKKRYGSLALQVYLKPLNTDRLPNSDSIAKYGGAGTQVYHECFEYDGVEKRIDGSADAYARVFSNHPPTDNEKLKLEYSAVFNADNPGESSIEYLLYESPWTKADEVVCSASYPKRYCQAEWRLDHLHNMGRYSLPNLREADYWDEAHLEATMFCFQEKDSVRPQGTAANSSFPGRVKACMDFRVDGMKDGKSFFAPVAPVGYFRSWEDGMVMCTLGANNNGEVTIEANAPLDLGMVQPFFKGNSRGYYGFNFRAHAKCRYVTSPGRTGGERRLYIEQASFSHVLYN